MPPRNEPPVLLVQWYELSKRLLARIESFPRSQRFVFGQRLADRSLGVLETLVEASYRPAGSRKSELPAPGSEVARGYGISKGASPPRSGCAIRVARAGARSAI